MTPKAPTEQEIRATLDRLDIVEFANSVYDVLGPIRDSDMALVRAGWKDDFFPRDDHPGTLWADLRASEAAELARAVDEAVHRAETIARDTLVEEVVKVALAFAQAHPDIPRGRWQPKVKVPA